MTATTPTAAPPERPSLEQQPGKPDVLVRLRRALAHLSKTHHLVADIEDAIATIEGLRAMNQRHCNDEPRMLAAEAALRSAIKIAGEVANEWDEVLHGRHPGKDLLALSGRLPGYRADIDAIHAAVTKPATQPAPLPDAPQTGEAGRG